MKTNKNYPYNFAVGRRKEAVARIRLYPDFKEDLTIGEEKVKKGDIFVNNKKVEAYFGLPSFIHSFEEPFRITNTLGKYTITAKIEGGGPKSQLEAFIHGLSRVLSELDEKNKAILKKKGFLTRDARVRERRKVGMGGKSRRRKQSPKR